MTNASIGTVRRADQPGDYVRFGVNPEVVEDREDGMRESSAVPGCFEWWYFEFSLKDGTGIVVAFLTKPLDDQSGAISPGLSIRVKHPQHADFAADLPVAPGEFHASADRCEVRAGRSSCRYEGQGKYVLDLLEEGIQGRIELQSAVPPARIGTGHLLFERDGREQYLGWLVAVPFGQAVVDVRIGNDAIQGVGGGYHDHNWGNGPMARAIHHWYWGRAMVQGFLVIAADTVTQDAFGPVHHTDLILAKDGRFIARGHQNVSCTELPGGRDPATGIPVAEELAFRFVDGATEYLAIFRQRGTVVARPLGDAAYHRFFGDFELRVSGEGKQESFTANRMTLELMWFGAPTSLDGLRLYTRMLSAV